MEEKPDYKEPAARTRRLGRELCDSKEASGDLVESEGKLHSLGLAQK